MSKETKARRLDALSDRLSSRVGVPRELAAAVVMQEAERIGTSRLRVFRSRRVAHVAVRRLRELRVEAEIESETVPQEPAPGPDETAVGAWRRDSWME